MRHSGCDCSQRVHRLRLLIVLLSLLCLSLTLSVLWRVAPSVYKSGVGVQDSRIGVQDSKIGVQDSRIGVQDSRIGVQDSEIGLQDLDIGVKDSDIGVQELDLGVQDSGAGVQKPIAGVQELRAGVQENGSAVARGTACPWLPLTLLSTRWSHHPHYPTNSWRQLRRRFPRVAAGGATPSWCRPTQRVAILLPFRGRENHLRRLLPRLHSLLALQAVQYRIFVIEQAGRQKFNRGALFNIGFKEAVKDFKATCLILHDVDMIPEVSLNLYRCGRRPRLLSSSISKFGYTIYSPTYFGGVVAVSTWHFVRANGFSNKFFGWGSEDTNFRWRLIWAGLKPGVTPLVLGRYTMVKHERDPTNEENPRRFILFDENRAIWHQDGLSSVQYRVVTRLPSRLFRHVRVVVRGPSMRPLVPYRLLDTVA